MRLKPISFQITDRLMPLFGPHRGAANQGLAFWRERILKSLLIAGLGLSIFAYVPAMRLAVTEGLWDLALVDSCAYLVLLLCLWFTNVKYAYRALALLVLVYLVGLFIILKVGILSGGPAWLFAAAVLSGVLLGLRGALAAIALNAVLLGAIGWLLSTGRLEPVGPFFQTLERATAAGAGFLFLNAGTAISVAVLVAGLENTSRQNERAARRLNRERAELISAKASLRAEVEERRVSEAALRESERRYKLLAENVSDVIWTVDLELRFTYLSPSVERLLGFAAEKLLRHSVNELLAPDSKALLARKIARVAERLEQSAGLPFELRNLEIKMARRDGTEIWAEIQNSFLLDDRGRVAGIIGVARDITQRRAYEQALLESEAKYRSILESIDEGYYEVDLAGNFTFVNRAVCEILGYTHKELIGLNNRDYTTEETSRKLFKTFNAVFHSGKPKRIMDYEIIKKDGDLRALELSTALMRNEAGEPVGFRGVARDITKRKQAEREKARLEAQLLQAEKMKAVGTLAGGVAHDLNNILSGVVSYPELLLLDLPSGHPMAAPLRTIQESGKKAAAIVQDLLTLARRGVSVSEIVCLNDIVTEYLESPEHLKLLQFHPGVAVDIRLEAGLPNISGSPHHLSKTLMNLVSNAAEAMPEGGTITISTEHRYIDRPINGYDRVDAGDYCVLAVADPGTGIAPEEVPRIFEPFYTKKVMGRSGTGLGMAVVWGTVKDHNGYIEVDSAPARGSVFTLYLPVTLKIKPCRDIPVAVADYRGRGERILVVDDVGDQREIATRMLSKLGYRVEAVGSGEEAIRRIASSPADLVILDMLMPPGIDGLDTFREIHRLNPGQKAIITSGFSETDRVKEAQRLGAGPLVKKPYSIEKLGLAVRSELAGRDREAA
jgi:two-component system, cell cycle sensor histidine kinase and response regulator CckA